MELHSGPYDVNLETLFPSLQVSSEGNLSPCKVIIPIIISYSKGIILTERSKKCLINIHTYIGVGPKINPFNVDEAK